MHAEEIKRVMDTIKPIYKSEELVEINEALEEWIILQGAGVYTVKIQWRVYSSGYQAWVEARTLNVIALPE